MAPAIPLIKISGTNTAMVVNEELSIGVTEAVSVRSRFKGDEGQMKLDDFLAGIKEEIANRENRKVEKED